MERPEAQPSEVIQSAHHADGSRLSSALDRHGPLLATLVLVAMVAVYGWSLWHDRELERQRAGAVEVSVEAPLPFSADSGAAEGILRLRNDGPLPLGVLSLGFRPGGLRLVTENLPLRVDAASSRLVVVRLEIDCTAMRDEKGPQSLQLRARTEDDRERVTAVRVKPLESIFTKLRREACDPPLLPIAEDLTLAYAGISAVSDGRITTRVLARNERDTAVTVVRISSVSGWPALDAGASTQLPVTLPAHGRLPLDLGWDVSRCVRSESGRFSTGLHLHLGPPDGTEELAVLEPGIDYTRDFFLRYAEVCP